MKKVTGYCPECRKEIKLYIDYMDASTFENNILVKGTYRLEKNCEHDVLDYANNLYHQEPQQIVSHK